MNKSILIGVVFAIVLTGCVTGGGERGAYQPLGVQAKNVASLSVDVIDDKVIVVSLEPIYIKQQDTGNAIYWYLDPAGPYYFPNTARDRGIKFDPPPLPGPPCDLYNGDKRIYVCTYNRAPRAKYRYTVSVTKDGTNILKSDPTVMND